MKHDINRSTNSYLVGYYDKNEEFWCVFESNDEIHAKSIFKEQKEFLPKEKWALIKKSTSYTNLNYEVE